MKPIENEPLSAFACGFCGNPLVQCTCKDKLGKAEIIKALPKDVIRITDNRLSIGQLVEQLESYDCPKNIIEKLQEWMLELIFDREKLRKWKQEEPNE